MKNSTKEDSKNSKSLVYGIKHSAIEPLNKSTKHLDEKFSLRRELERTSASIVSSEIMGIKNSTTNEKMSTKNEEMCLNASKKCQSFQIADKTCIKQEKENDFGNEELKTIEQKILYQNDEKIETTKRTLDEVPRETTNAVKTSSLYPADSGLQLLSLLSTESIRKSQKCTSTQNNKLELSNFVDSITSQSPTNTKTNIITSTESQSSQHTPIYQDVTTTPKCRLSKKKSCDLVTSQTIVTPPSSSMTHLIQPCFRTGYIRGFTSPQHTQPLQENTSRWTPQSEPNLKSWIPPSDDPMSQTFLRMPFTYQSLQFQRNHDNQRHIKRPMNAFMVWAKKNRSSIAKRFPNASNAEISVRLGNMWNQLPSNEQKPYFEEANHLKEKHRHDNPNWVYQPRPGKKCRKALFTSPQSSSFSRHVVGKHSEEAANYSRSSPSSPTVKSPAWIVSKPELSEDELQTRIVEDLLEEETDGSTGNPTLDKYIDEWLSPKKLRHDEGDCLMNDAMLASAVEYEEQNILEAEMNYDGKEFEKYIKQLKARGNNIIKFDNNINNLLDEEDEL